MTCSHADYDDATINLLHRAALTHAIALDTGLTAVPFNALLLLSRWAQQTLHQCLKRQIRIKMAQVELPATLDRADKGTWRYALTHLGLVRAQAIQRAGRDLWQPPLYDPGDQRRVLPDQARKKASSARRFCMEVGR
jgi:hypothetical protein